jgi:hypothetical protein
LQQNNSLFSPHYMFLVFAPDFFLGYLVCHPRLQNPFCLQTAQDAQRFSQLNLIWFFFPLNPFQDGSSRYTNLLSCSVICGMNSMSCLRFAGQLGGTVVVKHWWYTTSLWCQL